MNRAAFFDAVRKSLFRGALSQSQVDGITAILDAWERYGDGDSKKLAYVLATPHHETGETFAPIGENLNYSADGLRKTFGKYFTAAQAKAYERQPQRIANRVYANRMGNGSEASGDGWKFRGRNFPQLTGGDNYEYASGLIGVDFVANPDAFMTLAYGALVLVDGMMKGRFTGKKLADYIRPGHVDFKEARRIINGVDRAADVAGYATKYAAALDVATDKTALGGEPLVDYSHFTRGKVYPELKTAQRMLFQKGYRGVGNPDGKFGSMSRNSWNSFRADNGQPADMTGEDIDHTIAMLQAAEDRELPERSVATLADIAPKSDIVQPALAVRVKAKVGKAGSAILGFLTFLGTAFMQFFSSLAPLREFFASLNPFWYVALVVIVCAVVYWMQDAQKKDAEKISDEQLDRYQSGERA